MIESTVDTKPAEARRVEPSLAPDDEALARHATRREHFLERLGKGVAILPAARTKYRSRDTEIRFRQDSDFFYLTGFDEPDAVAVLTPHDPERRLTMFVRPRDAEREVWDGVRAGVDGARSVFGADAAHTVQELEDLLRELLEPADAIHYALGSDPVLDSIITELVVSFRRTRQRAGRGPVSIVDPGEVLGEMRVVKDAAELDRAACRGTHQRRAGTSPPWPRPTARRREWEIEAALESAFRSAGAHGPAYPSIVASGEGATTLHYVANDRRAAAGELLLVDAGAEWRMYCGDITRTFPVSGRFSAEQRSLYDVVLAAEEAAIAAVRPGAPVADAHLAAVRVLARGLVDHGLLAGDVDGIVERGEYKRFYMHQTSHWLGLDVHDVGLYARDGRSVELRPGMVLTVEPGLYLPTADDVPERFLRLRRRHGHEHPACLNLTESDFGGPGLEGCNDYLVITRPDAIEACTRPSSRSAATCSRRTRSARTG
jgi:Xaa-Pro aminopeptidase